jgi:hypothetical protein
MTRMRLRESPIVALYIPDRARALWDRCGVARYNIPLGHFRTLFSSHLYFDLDYHTIYRTFSSLYVSDSIV